MAGKVVDLDPNTRLSKEALGHIKKTVADLKVDDIRSLTIVMAPMKGAPTVQVFGLDFETVGYTQTILQTIAQQLLAEEFSIKNEFPK